MAPKLPQLGPRTRKFLRYFTITVLAVVVFVFALQLTFPYERVKDKMVEVHYTGTLANGSKFDSSHDRHRPFSFKLGAGQVIKGWDQGLVGMRVGGRRRLIIPSELAYGAAGSPPTIPANSALVFDVDLEKIG